MRPRTPKPLSCLPAGIKAPPPPQRALLCVSHPPCGRSPSCGCSPGCVCVCVCGQGRPGGPGVRVRWLAGRRDGWAGGGRGGGPGWQGCGAMRAAPHSLWAHPAHQGTGTCARACTHTHTHAHTCAHMRKGRRTDGNGARRRETSRPPRRYCGAAAGSGRAERWEATAAPWPHGSAGYTTQASNILSRLTRPCVHTYTTRPAKRARDADAAHAAPHPPPLAAPPPPTLCFLPPPPTPHPPQAAAPTITDTPRGAAAAAAASQPPPPRASHPVPSRTTPTAAHAMLLLLPAAATMLLPEAVSLHPITHNGKGRLHGTTRDARCQCHW